MKHFLTTAVALLMTCNSFAQNTIILGDMNGDGKLTIEDVTLLTNDILTGNTTVYGESGEFFYSPSGTKIEYVDLGLPSGTLWATCNVGARSPEDNGNYYAWGETAPQAVTAYDYDSYKWINVGEHSGYGTNKYQMEDGQTAGIWYKDGVFIGDGKSTLDAEDDAATVNCGKDWQIPTAKQFQELINSNYTNAQWAIQNGAGGLLVTSKMKGHTDKSIFLPAAGFRTLGSLYSADQTSAGAGGFYFSRTLRETTSVRSLWFTQTSKKMTGAGRSSGYSIRPVLTPESSHIFYVQQIQLSDEVVDMTVGLTKTISATPLPEQATDKMVVWSSSDESIAIVDASGKITAISAGIATITATSEDEMGAQSSCRVIVHGFVDLGLPSGTLWATENVGASSSTEFGNYYAWGETTPHDSENPYTSDYYTQTKYNATDGKTELEAADDAASANWGPEWQTPSNEQANELINSDYTTVTYEKSPTQGMRIVSKVPGYEGNSIFLPSSGFYIGTTLRGGIPVYWTRTLNNGNTSRADVLGYRNSAASVDYLGRYNGTPVRPVLTTLKSRIVYVTDLTLSETKKQITEGEDFTLSCTASPANATSHAVKWSSSDTDVATVSESGKVTAVKAGTATITATAIDGSEVTASCEVTVKAFVKVKEIKLSENFVYLVSAYNPDEIIGKDQIKIEATVKPATATNQELNWYVDMPDVVTVENGLLTSNNQYYRGQVTLTCAATDGSGVSATCKINIVLAVSIDGTYWATDYLKDENGDYLYYAWGETDGHTAAENYDFSENNYFWTDKGKYSDHYTPLYLEDDPAYNLNHIMRLPNSRDVSELYRFYSMDYGKDIIFGNVFASNCVWLERCGYYEGTELVNPNDCAFWIDGGDYSIYDYSNKTETKVNKAVIINDYDSKPLECPDFKGHRGLLVRPVIDWSNKYQYIFDK